MKHKRPPAYMLTGSYPPEVLVSLGFWPDCGCGKCYAIHCLGDALAQFAERDRDAERYRWLRARKPGSKYRIAGLIYSDGDANFDAAIDAAMAKAER